MKLTFVFALIFGMIWQLNAQNFAGVFTLEANGSIAYLSLETKDSVNYTGSLIIENTEFDVDGKMLNGVLSGRIGQLPNINFFDAGFVGNVLNLTMMEADVNGNPNVFTAQIYPFTPANPGVSDQRKAEDVIINGQLLSEVQITEIEIKYGIRPVPGNYWYDKVSGLYGAVGYAAFGFMYPNHDFGQVSRNASAGNTGVIMNGRELPMDEWAVWSYIVGYYIQPGDYWLDDKGNAGYTGYDMPLVNLFTAARQNAYNGQGNGGDNFWSSRFSAGNSNADNTQGYVSVPGYGPVGYGF
ncbi:MAG TPA: hypothetical protein P5514_01830 [Bacteroidales bacterium]|nr:hypothetical protein [Bacteroidales bacterium]